MKKLMFAVAMAAAMTASADYTWTFGGGAYSGNNTPLASSTCYLVYLGTNPTTGSGTFGSNKVQINNSAAAAFANGWANATGTFSAFLNDYGATVIAKHDGASAFSMNFDSLADGVYTTIVATDAEVVSGKGSLFFFTARDLNNESGLGWNTGDNVTKLMTSNGAAPGWVGSAATVPEPTSALLMLLGMAGLALRRKQA